MIAHGNPAADSTPFEALKEARLYENAPEQAVICNLCAHRCYIPAGRVGICKVRENRAGRLYTLVYDRIIALDIDPIEKKPFFHFLLNRHGGLQFSLSLLSELGDLADAARSSRRNHRSDVLAARNCP
jgi:hypothetical protein